MIAQIQGRVVHAEIASLVIDVNGVGYLVNVAPTIAAKAHLGEKLTLQTSLVVREDSWTLYGFESLDDRALFEKLQTVTGIGPRVAHSLLAFYAADELREIIAQGSADALERVPGIGKKVASRVILELKEKFATFTSGNARANAAWHKKVIEALTGLGYSTKEAEKSLERALDSFDGEPRESDLAELLRRSLAESRKR